MAQIQEKLPSWSKLSKTDHYYHKVRYSGETLSIIAEWYTGKIANWHYLAKTNRQLDPDHIRIGTIIKIPEQLLHTRRPMPKSFVRAVVKREKRRAKPVARAPTRKKPAYYYHKVRYSGETLSLIAKWYTGDFENWHTLIKENPRLNPNRITVGNRIRIPRKLLHTRKPMPKSYVVGSVRTRKPEPPPPAPSKAETTITAEKQSEPPVEEIEAFELFGPK